MEENNWYFMGPVDEDLLVSSLCTSWQPKKFLEAVAGSNWTVYSFFLFFRTGGKLQI